jgi:hypothetical protein
MTLSNWPRLALRCAGLMVLAIGLSHFFMPGFGYDPQDLLAVPKQQRAHFVYLGTYAIGLFLVCFAILTLVAGKTRPTLQMTIFLGLMTLVWGARFGLELVYPVNIPLFFLENPHPVLAATIFLIWLAYGVGFFGSARTLSRLEP